MTGSTSNTIFDNFKLQSSMSLEWTQKVSIEAKELNKQKVAINYKGNNNHKGRGKFSEYPEVLNKNYIRSLRRYLKEQYKHFITQSTFNSYQVSKRNRLNSFYTNHLKNHSEYAQRVNESQELGILHILSILLQENISYRSDSKGFRTLKNNMNKMIKVYSRRLFEPIIAIPEFKMFTVILKEAGVLAKIIKSYPTLSKSKDAYEMIIENIIEAIIN